MAESRNVAEWQRVARQWLKSKPSGFVFKSREIYAWVADGGVELLPGDLQPLSGSDRPLWRHRLSLALYKLRCNRELLHPGISRHILMVP